MKNKRLIVVTYGFPPIGGAASERALMLTRYLVQLGWDVTVYCANVDMPHLFHDEAAVDLIPANVTLHRVQEPAWYQWVRQSRILRNSADFTLAHLDPSQPWTRACQAQIKQNEQPSPQTYLLTTSPPHSIHQIGVNLSKSHQFKWLMDMRDAWVENTTMRHYSMVHQKLSERAYAQAVRHATYIIANTASMQQLIAVRFPESQERITVIPNGYDEALFADAVPYRPPETVDKLLILYAGGTYGGWVTTILQQLLDANTTPDVRVYLVGELESSEPYDVNRPIGLGHKSFHQVPAYLLGADWLVLCMPQSEAGSARILLKAYGYARAGKPILYLGPKNATWDYLNERTSVVQFELSALAEAAQSLANFVSVTNHSLIRQDSFEARAQLIDKLLVEPPKRLS